MNQLFRLLFAALAVCISPLCAAEDIDIYTNNGGSGDYPNVIIALDNSSNWSNARQDWPTDGSPPVPCGNDCNKQGYYELKAIRSVILGLPADSTGALKVNLGLMLFNNSNATRDGAYVRSHLRPMTGANKALFLAHIDYMIQHFNTETTGSSVQYSAMMFDLFKYFGGFTNPTNAPAGVAPTVSPPPTYSGVQVFGVPFWGSNNAEATEGPDSAAYNGINYVPAIASGCAKNYVIFIGNGFPAKDNTVPDMGEVLKLLKDPAQPPASLTEFDLETEVTSTTYGSWTDQSSCSASCAAPTNTANAEYQCVSSGCSAGTQKIQTRTVTLTQSFGAFSDQACVPDATCVAPKDTKDTGYQCVQSSCPAGQKTVQSRTIDTTFGAWVNTVPACLDASASAPADTPSAGYQFSTTGCDRNNKKLQSRSITSTTTYGSWTDVPTCSSSCVAPASTATVGYQCARSTCGGGEQQIQYRSIVTTTTTTRAQPTNNQAYRYADEFADFLFKTDVSSLSSQQNVITYAIDVCKDQCDADQTALLRNMAKYGGGNYCKASSESAIAICFQQALTDIMAVNSVFASASLPVNATNRSQNENQVYIGMFRPTTDARPRWYGNLKRYQFGFFDNGTTVDLADANGERAVNYNTGFIGDCAASFWTSNPATSTQYWSNVIVTPPPIGRCPSYRGAAYNPEGDYPDGPFVEKGAVSQVLRLGNNPPYATNTPTFAVNRTIKTVNAAGTALESYTNSSDDGLHIRGYDTGDQHPGEPTTGGGVNADARPSIHGDVVHSRPMPINYGTGQIAIYYGANDGMFRSVNAATGKEMWAFFAPEFSGKIARLRNNSPYIYYPTTIYADGTPTAPKDYFFDGGMGVYQTADNSKVWIYPSMRRGGRMVYSLDVTTKSGTGASFNVTPEFKWRFGCAPDGTCYNGKASNPAASVEVAAHIANIGQTWSQPVVTPLKNADGTARLALIFGGGYDNCEDAQTASPSCGTTKGNRIYVVDADTGALIKAFVTDRAVAADVALLDMDVDGKADYAYAVDLGGNVYRINLVSTSLGRLDPANWDIQKIAGTAGAGRKFHYPPVILANQGNVYVGVGSGDREHPLYSDYPYTNTATVPHRYYVYLDMPKTHCPTGTGAGTSAACATDDLDSSTYMNDVTSVDDCTDVVTDVLAGSSLKGWFRSLSRGEQVVTGSVITAGAVNFSTNKPTPPSDNACSSNLGEARGYRLDFFNGRGAIDVTRGTCGTSQIFSGGGLPPTPVIARVAIATGTGTEKVVSVCVGCASADGTGQGSGIGGGTYKPKITGTRSRAYWYTESEKGN